MKLVKQTILAFQGGNSDKVYEVDLCEVGSNEYVVNFRYGRSGTALKEGSKTPLPVNKDKAEQVFASLVESKIKKGYYDTAKGIQSQIQTESSAIDLSQVQPSGSPKEQAILARLIVHSANARFPETKTPEQTSFWQRIRQLVDSASGKTKKQASSKPLERAIWRAGDLAIKAAEPLLLSLLSADQQRNYAIVYALGRCGSSQSIPQLQKFYQTKGLPNHLHRLVSEALLSLLAETEKAALQDDLLQSLPANLYQTAKSKNSEILAAALENHLQVNKADHYEVLTVLYQSGLECARPVLLRFLAESELKPPYFKPIRHIFKLAEYRQDAEFFGIIAYRFEKQKAMFQHGAWGWTNAYLADGKYHSFEDTELKRELASSKSRLAYSNKTREYLRRRVWRTLRRLGEDQSAHYVDMAAGVLLAFSDTDALEARTASVYRLREGNANLPSWQRYQGQTIYLDSYCTYWAFNHILYRNSPRYCPASQSWQCQHSYRPDQPAPVKREEAFPDLWSKAPEKLLHLLLHSHCQPVHQFAVKALQECNSFYPQIDDLTIISFLKAQYEYTVQFGLDLAQQRYADKSMPVAVIEAAIFSTVQIVRYQAQAWINQQREVFLSDGQFIAALVVSEYADNRTFIRQLLRSIQFNDEQANALIGRLIAALQGFNETQNQQAADIAETLLKSFGPQLRLIGLSVIRDLLEHPLLPVQELGADVLLNYYPPENLPEDILYLLLDSKHPSIAVIGVRLLSQYSDIQLLAQADLLVILAAHSQADMRATATPLIKRLLINLPDSAFKLQDLLIERLLKPNLAEGVPSELVNLLKADFKTTLAQVSADMIFHLLKAKKPQAQELGGLLLAENPQASELSVKQIIALNNHEILSIRQAAWQMCEQNVERFKADMEDSVKLLESDWEDSRRFAFDWFEHRLGPQELRPDILVAVCDSVREDVQQFGRKLLIKYFQAEDGQQYMLKLSEHPSKTMQLFVTHYLERYAAGSPERLSLLKPYFFNALSRVNKGGVTKKRLYHFLENEALKSQEAAVIVAEILNRQSATIAVADKAAAIRTIFKITKTYPNIETVLSVP